MHPGGGDFENDLFQNIPSAALNFAMMSPIFGNGGFVVQPASPGVVQSGFPSVPYMPLEAIIYQQQSNTQVTPTSIVGGSNTGQQVINSTQTANDATGTSRVLNGNQQTP